MAGPRRRKDFGVSLDGSALKLLEKVDAAAEGGFARLVDALEQRYQPADQIALYRTQLRSLRQSPKETLGDLGDRVERLVRLAYPNAEGDIADDLARDSFVASLGEGELRSWVCQARPATFAEARAAALQGEAFAQAERDKGGLIRTISSSAPGPVRHQEGVTEDPTKALLTQILARLESLESGGGPTRRRGCFQCGEMGHFKRDCPRRPGNHPPEGAVPGAPPPSGNGKGQS